jgi:hypothetical protein
MKFFVSEKIYTVPKSGTFAAGNTVVFQFDRWRKRLQKLTIVANVTLGAGMVTSGAGRAQLEGLFESVKFSVSDNGQASRDARDAGSAQLLYFDRFFGGQQSGIAATAIGQNAPGTYDLEVPIHIVHPASDGLPRYRMSMPFWERDANGQGLGEDPTLTIVCAALDSASLGIKTGTLTYNSVKIVAEFLEVRPEDNIAYVPCLLSTAPFDVSAGGGTEQLFRFPPDGHLTSVVFEPFSTVATQVYGDIRTATTDRYKLNFGGTLLTEIDPVYKRAQADRWAGAFPSDVAAMHAHNINANIFPIDFWHMNNLSGSEGFDSVPNLYAAGANKGEALELAPTSIVASKRFRLTLWKVMSPSPAALVGA